MFCTNSVGYVGYLTWTGGSEAVLRQIFVVQEQRGKGYAKAALLFWVMRYAETLGMPFGVESPNEKTIGLLIGLGFARQENDKIIGNGCFMFVEM